MITIPAPNIANTIADNRIRSATGPSWSRMMDATGDAAVRDPADPSRIAPYFDGSDHLHLNLAGYVALGNAVPLELLLDPACS